MSHDVRFGFVRVSPERNFGLEVSRETRRSRADQIPFGKTGVFVLIPVRVPVFARIIISGHGDLVAFR